MNDNEKREREERQDESWWEVTRGALRSLLIPVLAIVTALILGALLIIITDDTVITAFGEGLGAGLRRAWEVISLAYGAFATGAFGDVYHITETLRIATPYIFAGLAVAFGFQGGLFNIGAEGQYFVAGLTSVFVGYSLTGLPMIIHLPLALLAGIAGGAIWAGIVGVLKAETGAHEVINSIMMNYIAYRLAEFMLDVGGPMAREGYRPVSPEVQPSAYLPQFFPSDPTIRLNAGFILALVAAAFVWWLLFKTTLGYEIRTVGQSPDAARYAGINVSKIIVITMLISGGLAGLAAPADILGVIHFMPNAFFAGYGFDAIALALLGKSHPLGVVLASLLFGALRAGATNMQGVAKIPIDITSILQGLIIVFVAAPAIIRTLYRVRVEKEQEIVLTRGWG
jgi:simple sugar transport system permease protein